MNMVQDAGLSRTNIYVERKMLKKIQEWTRKEEKKNQCIKKFEVSSIKHMMRQCCLRGFSHVQQKPPLRSIDIHQVGQDTRT